MFRTDLISHTDFHKGFWYKSNYSNWYYFKEQDRDYTLNNLDYSTVDKDLLPLVKLLHKNNIPTTPSCSGHDYSEDYFVDLFQKIKVEEYIINSVGLELTNIETQEKVKFYHPTYKFLYDKQSFLSLIPPYSKQGVLGILGDFSYIDIKDIDIVLDNQITLFLVKENNKKAWKELENAFQSIWKH